MQKTAQQILWAQFKQSPYSVAPAAWQGKRFPNVGYEDISALHSNHYLTNTVQVCCGSFFLCACVCVFFFFTRSSYTSVKTQMFVFLTLKRQRRSFMLMCLHLFSDSFSTDWWGFFFFAFQLLDNTSQTIRRSTI